MAYQKSGRHFRWRGCGYADGRGRETKFPASPAQISVFAANAPGDLSKIELDRTSELVGGPFISDPSIRSFHTAGLKEAKSS